VHLGVAVFQPSHWRCISGSWALTKIQTQTNNNETIQAKNITMKLNSSSTVSSCRKIVYSVQLHALAMPTPSGPEAVKYWNFSFSLPLGSRAR
jgi:hypothetical protein